MPRQILCTALLLCAPLLFAQSHDTDPPEANPGRPTVSTPATLTPVGYLQFENGTLYATESPEFATRLGINQVTKLTLNSRFEVLALSEPLVHSSVSGKVGSDNRPGEVFAGVQAVLTHGEGIRPTISGSYIRRLYESPAPEIDIGTFRNSALLLISNDMAGFHFDLNGMITEQADGIVRRAQFGQSLSISHPAGKFTLSGELWHFSQPLTRGNAVGNLWAASYPIKPNLIVDAGFNHGLTSTSTQWEGFAGFTWVLPHRLWRGSASQ